MNAERRDDELIAAYLDEELRGSDLARAEELLARDPASRQLLDDLKSQKALLASLPREKLGDDFAERVLRRAEREMVVPAAAARMVAAAAPSPVSGELQPAASRTLRMPQGRRPWIYAATALAAGLLIMFLSRTEEKAGHIVQVAEHKPLPTGEISATGSSSKAMANTSLDHVGDLRRDEKKHDETKYAEPRGVVAAPASPKAEEPSPRMLTKEGSSGATKDLALQTAPNDDAQIRKSLADAGLGQLSDELIVETQTLALEAARDNKTPVQINPGVLVFQCAVEPSAWRAKEVEKVLTGNNITVDPERQSTNRNSKDQNELAKLSAETVTDEPLEVLYILAPSDQITAAVEQLTDNKNVVVQSQTSVGAEGVQAGNERRADKSQSLVGRARRLTSSLDESSALQGQSLANHAATATQPSPAIQPAAPATPAPTADADTAGTVQQAPASKQLNLPNDGPVYQRAVFVFRAAEPPARQAGPAAATAPAARPAESTEKAK
jgi:hypothetical protein